MYVRTLIGHYLMSAHTMSVIQLSIYFTYAVIGKKLTINTTISFIKSFMTAHFNIYVRTLYTVI